METSCRIFENVINILDYIFLSVFISYLLSGAYVILSIKYHMPLVCF